MGGCDEILATRVQGAANRNTLPASKLGTLYTLFMGLLSDKRFLDAGYVSDFQCLYISNQQTGQTRGDCLTTRLLLLFFFVW